jgi:hypothetical protein
MSNLRRILLLMICFSNLLKHHMTPVFQVWLFISLNSTFLIYIVKCKPYESIKTNSIEMFNSGIVLVISFFMLYYTKYQNSSETDLGDGIFLWVESQEYLDFIYRAIFVFMISGNILVMILTLILKAVMK